MKKITALIMVGIFLLCFGLQAFAVSENGETVYQMELSDGTVVEYYLDEHLSPYQMNDGQKVYLALPLEHLKITDPALVAELDASIGNTVTRGVPTDTYSLGTNRYNVHLDFRNDKSFVTPIFQYVGSNPFLKVKASNIDKAPFAGKEFNVCYMYYQSADDTWFQACYYGVDCSDSDGLAIQHFPDIRPYGRFVISKSSNIYSADFSIFTSPYAH